MAHLLGSEFIIAHLRSDVLDIQATLKDIIARTSRCNVMSWKFPDRLACDVDIAALMEQYEFSDDVESNQVAHIVLLELVIDRFYLLSHCLTRFMDLTISAVNSGTASAQSSTATTSVGITVLKHWNKVMQVNAFIAQLANDLRMNRKKLKESEAESELARSSVLSGSNTSLNSVSSSAGPSKSLGAAQKPPLPPVPPGRGSEASLITAQSCQTVETAFAPCSACHEVQACMKEVSKIVMSQCQKESLPTNLFKYCASIKDLETAWLDKNEILRWKNELRKDLQRLQKHYDATAERNKGLLADIDRITNQRGALQARVDNFEAELQQEAMKQQRLAKEADQRLELFKLDKEAELQRQQTEAKNLARAKTSLEQEVSDLRTSLDRQKALLQILDRLKFAIQDDGSADFLELESCVIRFRDRIRTLEKFVAEKDEQLCAENAKANSFEKQVQALHGKQEKLMGRLEELSNRNEELQNQLDEAEDEMEQLTVKLKTLETENLKKTMQMKEHELLAETVSKERELLAKRIHELEGDLKEMEETTERLRQEQRLLLEYPDLNGPVNNTASEEGSVLEQMSCQVKANEARIRLLGDQTNHLRETISKIMSISGGDGDVLPNDEPPASHWQPNRDDPNRTWTMEESLAKEHVPEGPSQVRLWEIPARRDAMPPPHPPRPSSRSVRPPSSSGHRPSSSGHRPPSSGHRPPSSAGTARQKSSSPNAAGQRSPSPLVQWSHGSHPPKRPPSHVCQNCGRSYKSAGELAMHSAYCGHA